MHFTTILAEALCLFSSLASSTPLTKRQSTSPTTLYKFSGSFKAAEGIYSRPNGQLIVSFFDAGQIWTVDPDTKKASKLFDLEGATCSAGITEVTTDVYAVVAGKYGGSGGNKAGSWAVWKLDFTGATPKASVVKTVPESGMWNGITTLDNDTVLVGDALKGAVFKMSISTGNYSIAIQDATMSPPSGMPMGLDGVRYNHNGTLYYTNIFKNSFYKLPIDATGKATGTPTSIWTNTQGDDMAFGADGSVYVATNGKITKVTPDGKTSSFATVAGATACVFGRTDKDKNTLYVASSSGNIVAVPGS